MLVFAPDVTGLTTGQPLNMMTHNRVGERERDAEEIRSKLFISSILSIFRGLH